MLGHTGNRGDLVIITVDRPGDIASATTVPRKSAEAVAGEKFNRKILGRIDTCAGLYQST